MTPYKDNIAYNNNQPVPEYRHHATGIDTQDQGHVMFSVMAVASYSEAITNIFD